MKKTTLGKMLGLILAMVIGTSTSVTAIAQEESEILFSETEDSEEIVEENSVLVGEPKIDLSVEFIGFGDETDAFISEYGEDAYRIHASRYSDEEYYLNIVLKMQPYMTNGVLEYVTCNDSDEYFRPNYWSSYGSTKDCFSVNMGRVPVEYLNSGTKLSFYAHWNKNVLNGCTLSANGGVFDENVLFGGSSITYTLGDDKSIKPVEGNDNNTTVEVTYDESRSVAYVPVMENGFLPLPKDGEGVSMDLAGRPYDGERLPFLGWNTRRDGSGEIYTGEQVFLEKVNWYSKKNRLDTPIRLYAMFPEYYGAEFILDGESYVGDYWTEKPDVSHTESLEKLFEIATDGAEDKFVKDGYTLFWFLNEDCTIPADFTTRIDDCKRIEDRLTVYGMWTENVPEEEKASGTVFFKGIDEETSITLEVGKTLDLSKYVFKKKGYTFKNWSATVDGKTRTYEKKAKIEKLFAKNGEELVLTANWDINTYKITYVLNGGTGNKDAAGSYNVETQTELFTPTKIGFVFKGWDVKVDGRKVTDPEELALVYDQENNRIPVGACGNLTFSARYVHFEYKILFHVEGIEEPIVLDNYGGEEPLRYADKVNFNSAALQVKYELEQKYGERKVADLHIEGFSKTPNGNVDYDRLKSYSKLTNDETELNLYAVLEDGIYSIDYHIDGYKGVTLSKPIFTFKKYNKKFALPKAKCPGYKFYGWEFDQSRKSDKSLFYSYVRKCTPYGCDYEFATVVAANANNDIEVWPHFVANKIKVYVDPNGSGVYEEVYDEKLDGGNGDWKSRKVTQKRAYGIVSYHGDLYSEWYDETMTEWYRPGYDFVGYSKNPKATDSDEIFTKLEPEYFNDVATSGSGTIYCIWKKSEYNVNIYGATLLDGEEIYVEDDWDFEYPAFPCTLKYGEGVILPKATMEGYVFLGWKVYDDNIGRFNKVAKKGGYVTAIKAGNCYDLDIYPVFRRCTYNLCFDANGGTFKNKKSGVIEKGLDYSEDVSNLVTELNRDNVKRKGYKLMGFSLDAKGKSGIILGADGKPVYKSHMLILNGNKKVTLYAIWKKIE